MKPSIPRFSFRRTLPPLVSCIILTGCSAHLPSIVGSKSLYETFEGKYIDTVTPRRWTPPLARQDIQDSGDSAIYLPDGETMARTRYTGLVENRQLEDYLNGILDKLLERAPIHGVNARVVLVGDDAYGDLQAMPDGVIVVPLRFVRESKSGDEIAWILGHEVSHIILEHHNARWVTEYQSRLVGAMENTLLLAGTTVAMARKVGLKVDTSTINEVIQIYNAAAAVSAISEEALFPVWSRSQEEEADLMGLDLATRAGYMVEGATDVLEKFKEWSGSRDERREQEIAKEQGRLQERLSSAETFDEFLGALGEHWSNSLKSAAAYLRKQIQADHKDIVARTEDMEQYIEREYSDYQAEMHAEGRNRVLARSSVKRVMAAYFKTWKAEKSLSDGHADEAEKLVRAAIRRSASVGRESYPRLIFYRVRTDQGATDKALRNLEIALMNPNASMSVYRQGIIQWVARGKPDQAQQLVDAAWKAFDHPPQLYPLRIRLMKAIDQKNPELNALLLECQQRADRRTRNKCREEFSGKS